MATHWQPLMSSLFILGAALANAILLPQPTGSARSSCQDAARSISLTPRTARSLCERAQHGQGATIPAPRERPSAESRQMHGNQRFIDHVIDHVVRYAWSRLADSRSDSARCGCAGSACGSGAWPGQTMLCRGPARCPMAPFAANRWPFPCIAGYASGVGAVAHSTSRSHPCSSTARGTPSKRVGWSAHSRRKIHPFGWGHPSLRPAILTPAIVRSHRAAPVKQ